MTATQDQSRAFVQAADQLPSLFVLSDEERAVLILLDELYDAGSTEDTAALELRRAELAGQLLQKIERYGSVIRTLDKLAEARKAEADRLRARAKTAEAGADWLKQQLLVHMLATGQDRIETPRFSFSVRTNPPAVIVTDPAAVPNEFNKTVITVTVDKRAVLDSVKATGVVPAGTDIQRGQRVDIR